MTPVDVPLVAQAATVPAVGRGAAELGSGGMVLRRIVLIVLAVALVVVGALTADHVEAAGANEHAVAVAAESPVIVPAAATTATPDPTVRGITTESGLGAAQELVLLICSILALLVLLVPALRSGPAGGLRRIGTGCSALVVLIRQAWIDADRPDRTALCIIRT